MTEGKKGPTVLVMDDDPALLRVVRLVLSSDGFSVDTAADGIAGLERFEAQPPAAIVLDLQMPRMDGRAFFRELRSRGHKTPVLILSAYGAEEACRELGADGAIGKPFDPDHLSNAVRRLVNGTLADEDGSSPGGRSE